MRQVIFILLLLTQFLTPSIAREVIPFNDGWTFKKGAFPKDFFMATALFDANWETVSIPHTWNAVDMQTDENNYYAGEAYYKKTYVPHSSLKDKRIFLRFEGVGSVAKVYINNALATQHKGAYSAFATEITHLLKYGEENTIIVCVDNTPRPDVIPINNRLFAVYGGIYRPIEMIITDKVNISVTDYASPGIYIDQKSITGKSADIEIRAKLENKHNTYKNITLECAIYDLNGKLTTSKATPISLSPQGRQTIQTSLSVKNPHLWQGLEDPYLYKTVVRIKDNNEVLDEVVQPLGIRHFELKAGDGMYLNGRKVPMYGTCRHQDWWQSGSALTNEQHDTDLAIIKEMGATTIRLAHYQQAEYIYSRCDSIGFMVWAEIPFVNRVSSEEADNAKQQMTELIRQNYNHPSIYVWGLHNEVYGYGETDFYNNETLFNPTISLTEELHDLTKSEDPYRYTASVNGHGNPAHGVNMNADIQGINRYFGWYERKIQDIAPWIEELERDYPMHKIMLAEYGAEANLNHQQENAGDVGDCCGFDRYYSESFATRFHEIQWGYISRSPHLLASYIWNTFDFATPLSSQGQVEARNMKGLVTFDRQIKKDPFYWYKANWSKEPVLYLTGRRATEREKEYTTVTVYSNLGQPQLFVNQEEITTIVTGTTEVHYVFENVRLREGENTIRTKVSNNGEVYEDTILWYYSKNGKQKSNELQPSERLEEHIGL